MSYPASAAGPASGDAFSVVLHGAGGTDRPDWREAIARTLTDPDDRALALTQLATAAARAGDLDRASRLAADADAGALARTRTGRSLARALAELATAAARGGDLDRASRLAADAEALARTLTDPRA